MKREPLVSVITPCYNGESHIRYFLDSLLSQTYNNIEFIFVNDGSIDRTEDIFMQYKPLLEQKGWKVIYHKQENGGLPNAINAGLKLFTGKYLTWPDSDDILYHNYFSRKVEFMESNLDCAIMLHKVDICREYDLENKKPYEWNIPDINHPTLDNLVFNLVPAPCLCACVRSEIFLKVNPQRHIYDESRGGQNWQMLLPLAYNKKVCYIEESLACYVERDSSMSHIKINEISRQNVYEDLLIRSIQSITAMPSSEKLNYIRKIKRRYATMRLKLRIRLALIAVLGKYFYKLKRLLNDKK